MARVNAELPAVERVRRFIIASEPFTIANGQLTPTLKVRRHAVRAVYGPALDALYDAKDASSRTRKRGPRSNVDPDLGSRFATIE